jgi:hypothetical protein
MPINWFAAGLCFGTAMPMIGLGYYGAAAWMLIVGIPNLWLGFALQGEAS